MRTITSVFFLLALFQFSHPIFAAPGTFSNRDALKQLYDTGTAPAVAEDFPAKNYSDGSNIGPVTNICSVLDLSDQPYGYDISRKTRVTPSYGPLIPGKTEQKLVFGDSHLSFEQTAAPVTSNLDLILTNPIYRTWIDENLGVTHFIPAQLLARKSGNYIAFRILITYNNSLIQNEEYYGYCYPAGQALF